MKEQWTVKDKARVYLVKDLRGKREIVFTCPLGFLITGRACEKLQPSCGGCNNFASRVWEKVHE